LEDDGYEVLRLDLDEDLVPTLTSTACDLAYLALHGKAGEDGTVQGLLDLLEIPYTGSDAIASALAWDKGVAKGLFARGGLATPPWVALSADAVRDMGASSALNHVLDRLGSPVIVKPAQGGASMGERLVPSAEDLPPALIAAFNYASVVLVERFVAGTEVAVSIVDGEVLPPVEVRPRAGQYDFAARYTHGATELVAPARIPPAALTACAQTARQAWDLVGCRHVARADMIVDDSATPWLLELDTCPGMTETSLLPAAAAAADWSFPSLCERVVDAALRDAGQSPAITGK
jgi:D-alanine-D-alanine ligase